MSKENEQKDNIEDKKEITLEDFKPAQAELDQLLYLNKILSRVENSKGFKHVKFDND